MTAAAPKRFYKQVSVEPVNEKFAVHLDGRPVRTPLKAKLELPTRRLANAIAEEWDAQTEKIDLSSMSMTSFASTALDRIMTRRQDAVGEIVKYAETDLLCYRANQPVALVARQDTIWQPHLDWLAEMHQIQLRTTDSIVHIEQPSTALAGLRRLVEVHDDYTLTGLYLLTTGTGSVVLGLAVLEGRLDAEGAVAASQLDEIFQAEIWGEDPMSAERRANLAQELIDTERFLNLLLAEA